MSTPTTAALPLVGATGWRVVENQLAALSDRYKVPEPTLRRMLHRYGDELPAVLAPIRDDPAQATPVDGTAGYLPVEFQWAVDHEGACTLDDVLTRRTHVAIEHPEAGADAAPAVAASLAPLLGWDEGKQREEVSAYLSKEPRLSTIV